MKELKSWEIVLTILIVALFVTSLILFPKEEPYQDKFKFYEAKCELEMNNAKIGKYLYNESDEITEITYDTGMASYGYWEESVFGDFEVIKEIHYGMKKINVSDALDKGFVYYSCPIEEVNITEKEISGEDELTLEWLQNNCNYTNGYVEGNEFTCGNYYVEYLE